MNAKSIDLLVAAQREMRLIVRMTTSGVLSRAGLTLDDMDDMKMAVDEAFTCLMEQPAAYHRIALHYEYDDQEVRICLAGEDGCTDQPAKPDPQDDDILRCILETMADEVLIGRCGSGTGRIELKKRRVKAGMTYGC